MALSGPQKGLKGSRDRLLGFCRLSGLECDSGIGDAHAYPSCLSGTDKVRKELGEGLPDFFLILYGFLPRSQRPTYRLDF